MAELSLRIVCDRVIAPHLCLLFGEGWARVVVYLAPPPVDWGAALASPLSKAWSALAAAGVAAGDAPDLRVAIEGPDGPETDEAMTRAYDAAFRAWAAGVGGLVAHRSERNASVADRLADMPEAAASVQFASSATLQASSAPPAAVAGATCDLRGGALGLPPGPPSARASIGPQDRPDLGGFGLVPRTFGSDRRTDPLAPPERGSQTSLMGLMGLQWSPIQADPADRPKPPLSGEAQGPRPPRAHLEGEGSAPRKEEGGTPQKEEDGAPQKEGTAPKPFSTDAWPFTPTIGRGVLVEGHLHRPGAQERREADMDAADSMVQTVRAYIRQYGSAPDFGSIRPSVREKVYNYIRSTTACPSASRAVVEEVRRRLALQPS